MTPVANPHIASDTPSIGCIPHPVTLPRETHHTVLARNLLSLTTW
jgi:hypothetical protein